MLHFLKIYTFHWLHFSTVTLLQLLLLCFSLTSHFSSTRHFFNATVSSVRRRKITMVQKSSRAKFKTKYVLLKQHLFLRHRQTCLLVQDKADIQSSRFLEKPANWFRLTCGGSLLSCADDSIGKRDLFFLLSSEIEQIFY